MKKSNKPKEFYYTGNTPEDKTFRDNQVIVSTARTIQEVEDMKASWESIQPYPTANIDYFLALLKLRQSVFRPHVILLSKGKVPKVLVVGRIENILKSFIFKGNILFKSKIRAIYIDIGCLIGNLSLQNCEIIISELIKSLKMREADVVSFNEVSTDSNICHLSNKFPGFFFRDYFPDIQTHYRMTLPSTMEEFYKTLSRNKRKQLRRKERRLYREFPEKISIRCFRKKEDVEEFCRDAEAVSKKTYLYALGSGFVNNTETRQLNVSLADHSSFIAYILYIDGKPCAFEGGIVYNNAYFSDYCGYDPQFKNFNIGTILLLKAIESICKDINFKYYDFGWMDVDYKHRFCDIKWDEANFYIYQPSLKGVFLNGKKVILSVAIKSVNIFLSGIEKLKFNWIRYIKHRAIRN